MSGSYPYWSDEELVELSAQARELFVDRYKREIRDAFVEVERECADEVRRLFEATRYLGDFGKDKDFFSKDRALLKPARYTTSPMISEDTLKIVGEKEGEVETIRQFMDRERFPWLEEGRTPGRDSPEVETAVAITAKLMAEQRLGTKLRNELSRAQEKATREQLQAAGMSFIEPKAIRDRLKDLGDSPKTGLTPSNYQEALKRNEYTREIRVAGAKCDVPARLPTGELLPIECKVSNTPLNSIKRLIRETGGKHEGWRSAFGGSLHTGAVLAGAFQVIHLQDAQAAGILIFFDHELGALKAFLDAGGQPRSAHKAR